MSEKKQLLSKIKYLERGINMKKSKLFVSLFLVISLVLSVFTACSKSEPDTKDSTSQTSTTPEETSSTSTSTESSEQSSTDEITEIQIMLQDLRGVAGKAQPVVDEINKLTEKEIGVTAKVTWVGNADYATQLSLAISSNEPYDLVMINPIPDSNFTTLTGNQQLMDITDLLNEYAKETLDLVSKYIGAYTIEGKIYGVPAYRNYSSSVYIIMRKDILEQIGMVEKAQNIKSWTEFEEILAAVAEKTDIAPIAGNKNISYQPGMIFNSDNFSDTILFDNLGDSLNVIYVDENNKVKSLTEVFKPQIERMKKWYDNGWVYRDSIITDDHVDTLMKAGVTFSSIQTSELGVETSKKEATGYDVVCVEVSPNLVASNFVNKFGLSVPVTADEPEAGVKWINELYTNPDMENLLVWGVEGVDYVLVDGEADYPEGVDANSVRYHTADFLYGNYFNAHPWKGNGADFRQRAKQALDAAPVSPYLGFAADTSSLSNIIASITAVRDQYSGQVLCGAWDDKVYNDYVQALKDAGLEEYMAEFQRQLDDWISKNK